MREAPSLANDSIAAAPHSGYGVVSGIAEAIGLISDSVCVWRKKPANSLCPPKPRNAQPPISGLTSWEWLLPMDETALQ